MQSGDRVRILRSLGMGLGSLLLLSGAVFASQSGSRADDRLNAAPSSSQEASESAEASQSPEINPFQGGEVQDASESPDASPEDEPGDDDVAGASANPSADEDQGQEDQQAGPAGAEDSSGADDRSGAAGSDDNSGHDGPSDHGDGGTDD
jgi:hypothetical protein